VLKVTLAAMRHHDAKDDMEKVERLIGDYLGGGLAVVGAADVLAALSEGQAEEVLPGTSLKELRSEEAGHVENRPSTKDSVKLSEAILAQARQTGARLRLVEDATLLAKVGGVGASLRYRD
jgi:peptide subunit release factor 1 (eRF1)